MTSSHVPFTITCTGCFGNGGRTGGQSALRWGRPRARQRSCPDQRATSRRRYGKCSSS